MLSSAGRGLPDTSAVTTGGGGYWVRADGVLWRRTPVAVVVLAAGAAEPFLLTGSGPALWQLLADPVDEAELCRRLAECYGTTVATVAPGVLEVLGHLADVGAVRRQS